LAAATLLICAQLAAAQETGHANSQQPEMLGLPQSQPGAVKRAGGQTGAESAEHRSVSPLSSEQRAELQRAIMGSNIHRADRASSSLSVGTRIPDSLRIYDVPERVADVLPQFRGFKYVVVQSELIIIDPGTLEVAAVLPM
ncbi:MAG: DUF1236 domain-containing protein, partial [Methylocapsa sp.]|nr:DUF1236 domain-containing protein [Methylocapsa sp.]